MDWFSIIASATVVSVFALLGYLFWAMQLYQKNLLTNIEAASASFDSSDMGPGEKQLALLRQYHDQGLSQSRISFRFSIAFACLGFVTIAASLFWGYKLETDRAYAPITEINRTIAGLQQRRAALEKTMDDFSIVSLDEIDRSDTYEALMAENRLLAARAGRQWRAWAGLAGHRLVYEQNPEPDWVDQLKDLSGAEYLDWPIHAESALRAIVLPDLGLEGRSVRYRYTDEKRAQELVEMIESGGAKRFQMWRNDHLMALRRPIPTEMDVGSNEELERRRADLINKIQDKVWANSTEPPLPFMNEFETEVSDLHDDVRNAVQATRLKSLQDSMEVAINSGFEIRSRLVELDAANNEVYVREQLRKERQAKLTEKLQDLNTQIANAEERRQFATESIASTSTASTWNSQGSVLGMIAGAIVEAVSALFFVQSNRSRELMVQFFDRLRSDRRFDESMKLVDDIGDSQLQDATRRELALGLSEVMPPVEN